MADEYIKFDTTVIGIDALINKASTVEEANMLFKAKAVLYSQQRYATDVQPEKRGRWIHDRQTQWKCSVCGNFLDFDGLNCGRGTAFYCPHCGADMRGDTE